MYFVTPETLFPFAYIKYPLTIKLTASRMSMLNQERMLVDYQGLVKEGPGSLWPKSTLGALVDGKRPLVTAGELGQSDVLDIAIGTSPLFTRYKTLFFWAMATSEA